MSSAKASPEASELLTGAATDDSLDAYAAREALTAVQAQSHAHRRLPQLRSALVRPAT